MAKGFDPSIVRNPYLWAFLAGVVCITAMRPLLRHVPAPPPVLFQLPDYTLVDSDGEPFGSTELRGSVYVANFFFTRCVSICPLSMRSMAGLQARYDEAGTDGIRLVSISVDPDYDTPERLRAYGEQFGVEPERWSLLTGDPEQVRDLVESGFKLPWGPAGPAHSGKLVLVDPRGAVRGYYDDDALGRDEIFHRSRHVRDERR